MKKNRLIALLLALIMSIALLAACSSADPNQPWENPYDPWAQQKTPKIDTTSDDDDAEEAEAEAEEAE